MWFLLSVLHPLLIAFALQISTFLHLYFESTEEYKQLLMANVFPTVIWAPTGCLRLTNVQHLCSCWRLEMADVELFCLCFTYFWICGLHWLFSFKLHIWQLCVWIQTRWCEASWPQWRSSFLFVVELKADL